MIAPMLLPSYMSASYYSVLINGCNTYATNKVPIPNYTDLTKCISLTCIWCFEATMLAPAGSQQRNAAMIHHAWIRGLSIKRSWLLLVYGAPGKECNDNTPRKLSCQSEAQNQHGMLFRHSDESAVSQEHMFQTVLHMASTINRCNY
jgi:hypothetical protein